MNTVKLIACAVATYAVVAFIMYILIQTMFVFPLSFVERFYF